MMHPKDVTRISRASTRRAVTRSTNDRLQTARLRRTATRRGLAPRLITLALIGALAAACGAPANAGSARSAGETASSGEAVAAIDGETEPNGETASDVEAASVGDAALDGREDDSGAPDDAASPAAIEVHFDDRELTARAPDGSVLLGWELPESRNETITHVLVHPGANATELDAVVATTRGEVASLYHLSVREGTDGALTEFPSHLQPQDDLEAVISLAWTPDAASLLWTELDNDGDVAVLRTVGWDEGPGTGRTADDNATFALDPPADIMIDGFRIEEDGSWTLQLTDGVGQYHELVMDRQADGALTLR